MSARDRCLCSIAYLKAEVPSDTGTVVQLSEGETPVLMSFNNGLLAAYLVDEGASYAYVQNRDLVEAGMTQMELHVEAVANLSALAESRLEVRKTGSIFVALMGGDFEASLLLVNEFWSEWYSHLAPGGFVVAVPARDILAFGDLASSEVIEELTQVCVRAKSCDHPLTSSLYRRVGNAWQRLPSN